MATESVVVVSTIPPGQDLFRLDIPRPGAELTLTNADSVLLPESARLPSLVTLLRDIAGEGSLVALEVHPQTREILRVRQPRPVHVTSLRELSQGLTEVVAEPLESRNYLTRTLEAYDDRLSLLRSSLDSQAVVLLTVNDDRFIIDVRMAMDEGPEGASGPFLLKHGVASFYERFYDKLLADILEWLRRRLRLILRPCISTERAAEVFQLMMARTCEPNAAPTPCIPFNYPDDGCWARAHEMARAMLGIGLSPRKVWNTGNLIAQTRNHPWCFVTYVYHVAPTLCVRTDSSIWSKRELVFDPALAGAPVSIADWKQILGDPAGKIETTGHETYTRTGGLDPNYTDTTYWLDHFRKALRDRSWAAWPPPYSNCP